MLTTLKMIAYHKKQFYLIRIMTGLNQHFLVVFGLFYLRAVAGEGYICWWCKKDQIYMITWKKVWGCCNIWFMITISLFCDTFPNVVVCWGVLLDEICINGFICFLGLLLPVVHQSRRFRDQLGLSRHCSHLRLRLEPSKWPAGTSQGS